MITNTYNIGNCSFHVTFTHSSIENMKHGTNTYDRQAVHAGTLNSKQTQSQNRNAPPTFKYEE